MSTPEKSPRPTRHTIDRTSLYAELRQSLNEWGYDSIGDRITVAQLDKLINAHWENGYDLAKRIEQYLCINPDLELVEILDSFDMSGYDHVKRATVQWVIDNDIKPLLPLQTSVKYAERGVIYDALITEIMSTYAYYLISVPSKGHSADGSRGFIVPFEVVEELNKDLIPAIAE